MGAQIMGRRALNQGVLKSLRFSLDRVFRGDRPEDTRDVRCFFEDPIRNNMLWVQVFQDGSDWTQPDWVLSDRWHLHWRTDVLDGTGDRLQPVDGGYATTSTYSVYLTRVK